ncbi:MAG: alpha-L-fucosidase [Mucilaginibacter polytrichastri]|nr:alpha-L-fucosidase [Mucilaginibacter polytrichastri]
MNRIFTAFFTCLFLAQGAFAQQKDYTQESPAQKQKRMQWWADDRFGMFVHWGLYAIPAGEYGDKTDGAEWIMQTHKIPTPEYESFAKRFDPTKFNAREWVKTAREAGAKYIVITSKHHDGFCLWDSKVTNYDVMDATPFKRDILQELYEACKAEKMTLGFYHSIMDWHQPDAKSKDPAFAIQPNTQADWAKYRETYLKPQLKELMERFHPAIMWFDGEWIPEWTEEQGKDLYNYLRAMDPKLIINNRISKARSGMQGMNKYKNAAGDFGTPEQEILKTGSNEYWESCMTLNDHWGFNKNDHNWKPADTLIYNLADIAAKGGNYLLNVGPTAEGLIPPESVERLGEMGKWLQVNGEAIYGTKPGKDAVKGDSLRFTQSKNGKVLYAILLKKPGEKGITLDGVTAKRVNLLGSDEKISFTKSGNGITVSLPQNAGTGYAPVLRIEQ